MDRTIDPRAESTWNKADNAYKHYLAYLSSKEDRLSLTFTDLVYIKNFKGGSTVICEPVATTSDKLCIFESTLRRYAETVESFKTLGELTDEEFLIAKENIITFVDSVNRPENAISGFGKSFSSALLHFYFPTLVPILDRRALNGSGIEGIKIDGQNQVTNLLELYPVLIDYFRNRLKADPNLTLRDLDKELFSKRLRTPPFQSE